MRLVLTIRICTAEIRRRTRAEGGKPEEDGSDGAGSFVSPFLGSLTLNLFALVFVCWFVRAFVWVCLWRRLCVTLCFVCSRGYLFVLTRVYAPLSLTLRHLLTVELHLPLNAGMT